jgi:hypothetical protein
VTISNPANNRWLVQTSLENKPDFHEADIRQRILWRLERLIVPPVDCPDVYLSNGCVLSVLQHSGAFSE